MNLDTRGFGTLVKVAPAGRSWTSPTAGGPVGRSALPTFDALNGAEPIWIDLGLVESDKEETKHEEEKIFRPSPGVMQLSDMRKTKFEREITLEMGECSNVHFLLLRKCLKTTSALADGVALGQHVPLSGGSSKFWVALQHYDDQTNAPMLVEQLWADVTVEGAVERAGGKHIKFTLKIRQLWSPLNTATGN